MTYSEAYSKLYCPEKLEAIKNFYLEAGLYDLSTVRKIQIGKHGNLHYLWTPLEGNFQSRFVAMYDLKYWDASPLLPEWEGIFCLPLVFIINKSEYLAEKWLPYHVGLAHELLHLRQVMRRADSEPGYLARASRYCMGLASESDVIPCVSYELEKIFLMEVEAHEQDWEMGQRHHLGSDDKGSFLIFMRYPSKELYVKHAVAQYLFMVLEKLTEKFPDQRKLVTDCFRMECERQGQRIFGANVSMQIALCAMESLKMMQNPHLTERLPLNAHKNKAFQRKAERMLAMAPLRKK